MQHYELPIDHKLDTPQPLLGGNAPDWLVLTAPAYRVLLVEHCDDTPTVYTIFRRVGVPLSFVKSLIAKQPDRDMNDLLDKLLALNLPAGLLSRSDAEHLVPKHARVLLVPTFLVEDVPLYDQNEIERVRAENNAQANLKRYGKKPSKSSKIWARGETVEPSYLPYPPAKQL